MRFVSIDTAQSGPGDRLRAIDADVVVFDLAAAVPESVIALWRARPNLLWIGVDLTSGRALVLSGQSPQLLTPDDLVKVIESHAQVERRP